MYGLMVACWWWPCWWETRTRAWTPTTTLPARVGALHQREDCPNAL